MNIQGWDITYTIQRAEPKPCLMKNAKNFRYKFFVYNPLWVFGNQPKENLTK